MGEVALPLTLDKDINRVLALRGQGETDEWWPETGLNRRRRPFQGRALPLSYLASAQTSVASLHVESG